MNSSERRLKIITILQSGKKQLSTAALAEMFSVSRRTIFRDLASIQKMNIPLTWDPYKGYGLLPGYTIPPIMFTTKEIATIGVGLNFVKSQPDKQMVSDAGSVETKILSALKPELKELLNSISEKTVIDPNQIKPQLKQEGGDWYLINTAISTNRRIIFNYLDKNNILTSRKVDPYIFVYYADHWNIIGHSHERGDKRNFILDRMQNIEVLDEKFSPKKKYTIEALIFGDTERKEKVEVLVDKEHFGLFKRNLPTKIFNHEAINSKKIKASFFFNNFEYLNDWLLRFGKTIIILKPRELAQKRIELLREMLDNQITGPLLK